MEICVSIATAMYLMYYNDYMCPGIIPNGISTSQYFIVCDGWGADNVYIGSTYVRRGVYITN